MFPWRFRKQRTGTSNLPPTNPAGMRVSSRKTTARNGRWGCRKTPMRGIVKWKISPRAKSASSDALSPCSYPHSDPVFPGVPVEIRLRAATYKSDSVVQTVGRSLRDGVLAVFGRVRALRRLSPKSFLSVIFHFVMLRPPWGQDTLPYQIKSKVESQKSLVVSG